MGFGTIVANVIMFISVLLIATGVMVVFKGVIEESTNSMRIQSQELSNNILASLEITSAVYNETVYTVNISILNTGKKILDIGYVDVFVDGFYIPRNITSRTIRVHPSTDIRNPGLLDSHEVLEVVVLNKPLIAGQHVVAVTTQYGNKEEYIFST